MGKKIEAESPEELSAKLAEVLAMHPEETAELKQLNKSDQRKFDDLQAKLMRMRAEKQAIEMFRTGTVQAVELRENSCLMINYDASDAVHGTSGTMTEEPVADAVKEAFKRLVPHVVRLDGLGYESLIFSYEKGFSERQEQFYARAAKKVSPCKVGIKYAMSETASVQIHYRYSPDYGEPQNRKTNWLSIEEFPQYAFWIELVLIVDWIRAETIMHLKLGKTAGGPTLFYDPLNELQHRATWLVQQLSEQETAHWGRSYSPQAAKGKNGE